MYAQRKAPQNPRKSHTRYSYRNAPIRAQMALAVRPAMNFGLMPDAVAVLRSNGLSLAPIAVSETSTSVSGTQILPTANVSDIESGDLKGLVVPAGQIDAASSAGLTEAIARAREVSAPVLAFGDGVAVTLEAMGQTEDGFADAPAILVLGDRIEAMADLEALAQAANQVAR